MLRSAFVVLITTLLLIPVASSAHSLNEACVSSSEDTFSVGPATVTRAEAHCEYGDGDWQSTYRYGEADVSEPSSGLFVRFYTEDTNATGGKQTNGERMDLRYQLVSVWVGSHHEALDLRVGAWARNYEASNEDGCHYTHRNAGGAVGKDGGFIGFSPSLPVEGCFDTPSVFDLLP